MNNILKPRPIAEQMLAAKVDDMTFQLFKEVCKSNNLTVSDGLRQLIDLAIKSSKTQVEPECGDILNVS
jgi:antitoxin component of RelBE/YafQ-DinJ toxin-antitoxin module